MGEMYKANYVDQSLVNKTAKRQAKNKVAKQTRKAQRGK